MTGFQAGATGDHIDLAANNGPGHGSVWGQGGNNGLAGGDVRGLINGGNTNVNVGGDTNATLQNVVSGDTIAATTNVIVLTGQTFFDATAIASALENNTYDIALTTALNNNNSAHMIIAYQDFNGNTHISDLALIANAGTTTQIDLMDIHVSDMVQLTGVTLNTLAAANIQFV